MYRNVATLLCIFVLFSFGYCFEGYYAYKDSIQQLFMDVSWGGTRDFAFSATKHSGTHSIQVNPSDYSALGLYCNSCVDTKIYKGVEFWVHGGTSGGQQITFSLKDSIGEAPGTIIYIASSFLANKWKKVSISFDDFPPGKYLGVQWQTHGNGGATYYVDDVLLVHKYADLCLDNTPSNRPLVIGYYPLYHLDAIDHVDYSKLSHIAIAAVFPSASGEIRSPYNWMNLELVKTYILYIVGRAREVGTKAILMLGGEGANFPCADRDVTPPNRNGPFNSATSVENVTTFAENLVAFAQELRLDGIDLDWEECIDAPGLTRLAQKVRSLWPRAFLSFPMAPLWNFFNPLPHSALVPLMSHIDVLNYMSYIPPHTGSGWYPAWDAVWHISPLKGDTSAHPYSIERSVNAALAAGINASQIGIGVGFFGTCWTYPIGHPVGQTAQNGGFLIPSDNVMTHANIEAYYKPYMDYFYDTTAEVPYLNSTTPVGPRNCTYISYDNDRSIKAKADYVQSLGLAGVIIWTVEQGVNSTLGNPSLEYVFNHFRAGVPVSINVSYCPDNSSSESEESDEISTTGVQDTTGAQSTTGVQTTGAQATTGSSTTGPDIDECTEDIANCDEHALCINTNGGYECVCADGYFGDGFTCSPGTAEQTCQSSIRFRTEAAGSWQDPNHHEWVSQWKVTIFITTKPLYALALNLSLPTGAPTFDLLINVSQRNDTLYEPTDYRLHNGIPLPANSILTFGYIVRGLLPVSISVESSLCSLPPVPCSLVARVRVRDEWASTKIIITEFNNTNPSTVYFADITLYFTPGARLDRDWEYIFKNPQSINTDIAAGAIDLTVPLNGFTAEDKQPRTAGGLILIWPSVVTNLELTLVIHSVRCTRT